MHYTLTTVNLALERSSDCIYVGLPGHAAILRLAHRFYPCSLGIENTPERSPYRSLWLRQQSAPRFVEGNPAQTYLVNSRAYRE